MKIAIADIEIGERLRSLKHAAVGGIAASFKSEGQLQPIVVRALGNNKFRLAAGAHRIAAAKLCGWTEIDATPLKLDGMSSELADVTAEIAEVDENIGRSDLDHAERVIFIDTRATLTAKRTALLKVEAEKQAHAAAGTRVEKDQAKKRLNKATKTAAKVSPVSYATAQQTGDRLPNAVVDQVAEETGLSKQLIHEARSIANQVGRDNLKVMAGTAIATRAEMRGFVALQKRDPAVAKDCIKKAAYAKAKGIGSKRGDVSGTELGYSPSGRYGAIVKKEKSDARLDLMKTAEGCMKTLYPVLQEIERLYAANRMYWAKLPPELKTGKMKFWEQRQENAVADRKLAWALSREVTQKPTGKEHKYQPSAPGESKDDVRKSLGKDAASIKAKAKKHPTDVIKDVVKFQDAPVVPLESVQAVIRRRQKKLA